MSPAILHVLAILIAVVAYVVLTVTGHDGNPVFVFIGGQGAGALVQLATNVKTDSGSQTDAVKVAAPRSTIGN